MHRPGCTLRPWRIERPGGRELHPDHSRSASIHRSLYIALGNQLFPPGGIQPPPRLAFMCEDHGLCTYVRHHQQKIALFFAAMRSYADELRQAGCEVVYRHIDDDQTYEDQLLACCREHDVEELVYHEIEDRFMAERMDRFAAKHKLSQRVLTTPMFLTTRDEFDDYLDRHARPFMADFYREQRRRLGILVDDAGKPAGGKWSFDADNRKKLPRNLDVPAVPEFDGSVHLDDVVETVRKRFPDHPGEAGDLWLPVTRQQAQAWLDRFLDERFELFGPYEDAISTRTHTAFHSVLSPALNLGLLTPREVLDKALDAASDKGTPMNSLEGFVRQVMGWREFIRGIYHRYDDTQQAANFFGHERELTADWYEATTGIDPLDHTIDGAVRYGWSHHIERLMVAGNLMTLCEIRPASAWRWFMEMYVDSSDWVMGPNVYGMALFSDGGIFATKPYVCGSNYLLKMSDHARGPWCDIVDGLYWRFVERNVNFFGGNPRLSVMVRGLARLDADRKRRIMAAAEAFLERCTA